MGVEVLSAVAAVFSGLSRGIRLVVNVALVGRVNGPSVQKVAAELDELRRYVQSFERRLYRAGVLGTAKAPPASPAVQREQQFQFPELYPWDPGQEMRWAKGAEGLRGQEAEVAQEEKVE